MQKAPEGSRKANGIRAVLCAGLLAGALDIVAAFVIYGLRGATPIRILQSIARGLLGVDAFSGGPWTAALGGLLHFTIATTAAGVYYAVSRQLPGLLDRSALSGVAYGTVVYLVMNFVVVPLSRVPRGPFEPRLAAVILVVHWVCVGLPIALTVRRYAPSRLPS